MTDLFDEPARGLSPSDRERPAPRFGTREEWLMAAVDLLRPWLAEHDADVPPVRAAAGFPQLSLERGVRGEYWPPESTNDGVGQIFVAPTMSNPVLVLEVLLHEMIHAATWPSGHRGEFTRVATAVGFEGRMTIGTTGEALNARMRHLVLDQLGTYPHSVVRPWRVRRTAPTWRTEAQCARGSGYAVRLTRKAADKFGMPDCPCHHLPMVEP